MKKSTYTRTALASLLTLCSFSGFAADFPSESMREIKKQESTNTSGKPEITSKKLKEKMDRICNAVPRKKAEETKLAAEQKKKDEMKLASEKKKKEEEMRLANEKIKNDKAKGSKANAKNGKDLKNDPKTEKAVSAKDSKAEKDKASRAKDSKIETKNIKSVTNKNIEDKSKAKATQATKNGDADLCLQAKSGLRITFGGVVDAQGYGKAGPKDDKYRRYNAMSGAPSISYYGVAPDKIKGANPIFPQGIGNVGDYSSDFGMVADAILHLRAENKNEDLGLLYGADVQFHVPVTEGKGVSQGVYAARGRGAHIFINSEYGDLKLGYQFGPEALMRLDATRIATVDGAADSDWFRKVNLEGSAASFPFYVTPRLWTESFSSESEKLSFRMAGKYNKGVMTTLPFRVAYYSPNYMGARFGVSYAPRYESSLFSVSDDIAGGSSNPDQVKIDEITGKFLDAGKLTVPDATVYGTTKVKALATPDNLTGESITDAKRNDALGLIAADLDTALVLKTDTNVKDDTSVSGYKRTYGVDDKAITDAAKASIMTKPIDYATADKLKGKIEAKLATKSGTDLPVSEVTAAVNAVLADIKALPDSTRAAAVKAAVGDAFGIPVVSKILRGPLSFGANQLRHVGPDYEHILSAGVSYEYDFDEYKVKVKASAVGEYGQAKKPSSDKHVYDEYVEYNDLMGANFGVSADYKIDEDRSAKFAASFAYLGKSGQPKGIQELSGTSYTDLPGTDARVKGIKDQFEGKDKDTMYWTAGAGYQRENVYTSLTYFGSKMNDGDKLHDVALGVQYDLSPACSKSKFVPYAALHYFITKEKGNDDLRTDGTVVPPNKGALLLTGVKFSF